VEWGREHGQCNGSGAVKWWSGGAGWWWWSGGNRDIGVGVVRLGAGTLIQGWEQSYQGQIQKEATKEIPPFFHSIPIGDL